MLLRYLRNLILHGQIDPVEFYRCDRYRVVYVENAKVACTAIKQVLFPEYSHAELGQDRFHEVLRPLASYKPSRDTDDYLYFTFLRDPQERLRSCWKDKIAGVAAHKGRSHFHTRSQALIFKLFGRVDVNAGSLSFDDFARAVSRIPYPLLDRHIMPQDPIREAVEAGQRHFIGRFETLEADWAQLAQQCGMPDLPRLNASTPAGNQAMPEA